MKERMRTELIDEFLEKNKLSKTGFCKKFNINYKELKRIYEQVYHFRLLTLVRLCRTLGVELKNFFEKIN